MKKQSSNNRSWFFEKDPTHQYAFWHHAFTVKECQKIITIGKRLQLNKGLVVEVENNNKSKVMSHKRRDSQVAWMGPNSDTEWIFRRLTDLIIDLNERFFKFDLFGFQEGCQFTHYKAPGAHYGKHVDTLAGQGVRKLSVTVQLSDPTTYKGGELYLYAVEEGQKLSAAQGTLLLFPSYILHEVKPVTQGERYSLVSWITGRPFK